MIEDTLAEAIDEIDQYLANHSFDDTYTGELRNQVIAVRLAMERLVCAHACPCPEVCGFNCRVVPTFDSPDRERPMWFWLSACPDYIKNQK